MPTIRHQLKVVLHQLRLTTIPLLPLFLAIFWVWTIHRGERSASIAAVAACDWQDWERWPADARPHRAILIADPQLVDPHTYPGRPWPLSSLTEKYTDRYMMRNYRLINERHDPDSIIFLGDMLDGGREWSPTSARALTKVQKWQLEKLSPETTALPHAAVQVHFEDAGWDRPSKPGQPLVAREAAQPIDLTEFVPGEDGRWRKYGNKQWESEYKRFGTIFMSPSQIYPAGQHELVVESERRQSAVNVENGASDTLLRHHRTSGRTRSVLASLPGNHDLGFGSGVQVPIRARYEWHFGDMNRLDVLGNHTFVSIDALSLAAWAQFEESGQETTGHQADRRKHIYAPTQTFVDSLGGLARNATAKMLSDMYGIKTSHRLMAHTASYMEPVPELSNRTSTEAQVLMAPNLKRSVEPTNELPVILLSHVPLYRPPETSCGKLRERGSALSISGGYQYQNVLTATLSNILAYKLESAGPFTHIFSGDDHDYCDVQHAYAVPNKAGLTIVREETVKSFSWAMGVRRPGFHMLSLWNPVDRDGRPFDEGADTIKTHLCLLPDQLGIFLRYASTAALTVAVLLARAMFLALRSSRHSNIDEDSSQMLLPLKVADVGKGRSKHRHRASSSSWKATSNGHLGVQRSANARARSISPGIGLLQVATSPFSASIKSAEYHASEDEESTLGDTDYLDVDDSQAKWRKRKRGRGQWRYALDELTFSSSIVAIVAVPYYLVLIWRG